ncbi:PIN domain-containing protein [Candidatus Roizmanbacteria bacterium]|nr:PIN domain-containing protein [Candidatus Roizmanbacteria bacterium]
MKKLVVDTNVFLRFLTNDIPKQAVRVEKRFKEAEKGKLQLIVLQITVVELLFQLQHWYDLNKSQAVEKLIRLFSPAWLEIDYKDAVFEALNRYKNSTIDFVDLLIWAISRKNKLAVLSFDKDFDKLEPKLRLNP